MEPNRKYFNERNWQSAELPDCIMVETFMGCNLRCEMCPVPQSRLAMNGRSPAAMSLETFKKVLEEVSDRPRTLHLNQMGEPLLNRSLADFVALAKSCGHTVTVTSNGTLMEEALAARLLDAGLDQITFSVDGFRAQTYESIRTGADYEEVRANIERFCELRNERKRSTRVDIHCILSDLTRDEIPQLKRYWEGKVDAVTILPLDDWAGKHALPGRFGARNWSARTCGETRYPCNLLWTTLAVSATGQVMLCCHDYKLLSGLPNVNEKALRQIWREDVAQQRRRHVEGSIDRDPCLTCDAWKTREPFFREPPVLRRLGARLRRVAARLGRLMPYLRPRGTS